MQPGDRREGGRGEGRRRREGEEGGWGEGRDGGEGERDSNLD